ncbi:MAG TPA: DUF427 domain-containing protein [Polyangiaceae bacterium]|jgi:uncharacterized protein (DUF427 family)
MKSPAHRDHPDHKVVESHAKGRVTAAVDGEIVADSSDVVRVDEDGSPPRYYFPRADVKMDRLARTDTTSVCPFKGKASYYSVQAGGRTIRDAVWSYEEPFEEHAGLANRIAFWSEKDPGIAIRTE